MSFFETVRNKVSAETAAIKYAGVKTVRRGRRMWAVCPLHGDLNPSMVFYDDGGRFFCFGCAKSGDASDFVSMYYGIPVLDAAKLIAADFGICEERLTGKEIERERELKNFSGALSGSIRYCDDALAAALRFWRFVKIRFSPGMCGGEFADLFAKACRLLPEMEYLDEEFRNADPEDQARMIIEYQKEFDAWHTRFMPGGEAWDDFSITKER